MDDITATLRAGIIAARSGDLDAARVSFVQVVKQNSRHEVAWLWLSSVMPTSEQSLQCLEHLLAINPENLQAREAKEILQVRMLLEEADLVRMNADAEPVASSPKLSMRLGDLLVEQQVLTEEQLAEALEEQQRLSRRGKPVRLGELLISTKMIKREQLANVLRTQIEAFRHHNQNSVVTALGQYLVKNKYITAAQLARSLSIQSEGNRSGKTPKLGDVLIRNGYLTQSQLERALIEQSEEFGLHFR